MYLLPFLLSIQVGLFIYQYNITPEGIWFWGHYLSNVFVIEVVISFHLCHIRDALYIFPILLDLVPQLSQVANQKKS